MPWEEFDPGQFARPLDATDKFMKTLCLSVSPLNREHWTVNTIALLDIGPLNAEEVVKLLQRAWTQTRFHHPFIASVLEETKLIYQTANEDVLAQWLSETVLVENQSVDSFLVSVRPKKYSSIHYFPTSSELVMRSHHWHVDGIGSLNLMHHFLQYLATDPPSPGFGDEWRNLPPSHSEAAGFPVQPTETAEIGAQKLFMGFIGNLPSIGLPCKKAFQSLGGTRRITEAFGHATASALLAACRQQQVSVASAVHAAIVVATQEMKTQNTGAKNYTSVASYNYRRYLLSPYDDASKWPIGCYMLGLPFSRPSANFATHAQEFQKIYHQPLRRGEFAHFEAYNLYCTKMATALSQPLPPNMPPPSQPQLSSLGLVDEYLQPTYQGKLNVSLLHVEIAPDIMSPGIVLYQWSWQGRFFLSANYNETFFTNKFVSRFLARTEEILFKELRVTVEN
ncbi:MAG: hypothetical protein Q9227_009346 [Pyrenula ochraceoflavens]